MIASKSSPASPKPNRSPYTKALQKAKRRGLTLAGVVQVVLTIGVFAYLMLQGQQDQSEKVKLRATVKRLESHADSTNIYEQTTDAKLDSLISLLEVKRIQDNKQDSVLQEMSLFVRQIKNMELKQSEVIRRLDTAGRNTLTEFMNSYPVEK